MVRRWEAVEKDDDNSCEPCEAVDGKTYRIRAEAYEDYPGGVGYKDCVGAQYGNACRGKVVKRRSSNNADNAQGTDMTDTRLLREFSMRLAEREIILGKVAQKPREVRPGQDWFKITNVSAEEAVIYIMDEIGFWGTTARGFIDELNTVSAPKIRVEINSPGGDVFDGIAIHTALAQHSAHVTTFVTGLAASAASYIAMAGDLIKMARNATMMIHDASGLVWGNATTMRAEADLLDKLTMNIADMYAMQAGGTAEEWFAKMDNTETWFTGREALAAGLVDEITDPDEEEENAPAVPTNLLSIAAFMYAGRAQAPDPEILQRSEESPETEQGDPGETPDPGEGESALSDDDVATTMLAILAEQIRSMP